MAGGRSLGVYSLDEAANYFTAALAVLDNNPECASDDQVAEFLVLYLELLIWTSRWKVIIDVVRRYLTRLDRVGDDLKVVFIRIGYFEALIVNGRYREAAVIRRQSSAIADRLGDTGSRYMLGAKLVASVFLSPMPLHELEIVKREALTVLSEMTDARFHSIRMLFGFDEVVRGRLNEARNSARELMQVGQSLNDPRYTGVALVLLSMIAMMSGSYAEALEYSEQSLSFPTQSLRSIAFGAKAAALVALRRIEEGAKLLEEVRRCCDAGGDVALLDRCEVLVGTCKMLQGRIADGLHVIEKAIPKAEKDGYKTMADFHRLYLAEVYLRFIAGGDEKVPLATLRKNLPIVLKVMFTGGTRIHGLATRVLENSHFDPTGHHVGYAKMILGLLYKVKKKRVLAVQHLTEARTILSQFGQTPILARVDTALAELKQ
jgi:tetratricopeptide (TPR) repeat protein